jgi:hypothetical protein
VGNCFVPELYELIAPSTKMNLRSEFCAVGAGIGAGSVGKPITRCVLETVKGGCGPSRDTPPDTSLSTTSTDDGGRVLTGNAYSRLVMSNRLTPIHLSYIHVYLYQFVHTLKTRGRTHYASLPRFVCGVDLKVREEEGKNFCKEAIATCAKVKAR